MLGFNGGLLGKKRKQEATTPGLWFPNERAIIAGFDPYWDNTSILLHMDGSNGSTTFTDSSTNAVAVTANGNAQISTAESKFGGASCFLNGTSDSLTFTDPALGTGDFTIEMWLKSSGNVQFAQIIGNEVSGGTSGYTFVINNNSSTGGQLALYRAGALVVSSSTGDWTDNSWHHIALVRSVNSFTIYTDGSANGTGTNTGSMNGTATAYVGRNNSFAPRNLVGYIDDLRITKGVARTITVPTAAFPDY
jgi:hypothetical protein